VLHGYEEAAKEIVAGGGRVGGETVGGGREAHPVVALPGGERAVVRRYRRGGLVRHLNGGRYFAGNRAFDELRATERARAGGVRTARVLVAAEHPRTFGYTALLATLLVPGAVDAARWLAREDAAAREAMLREAGRQLGMMHAAGVQHPDANLRNLLVTAGGDGVRVAVIDFDRARVHDGEVPAPRRAADLRRLARSARKLRAEVAWEALREGYGPGWPAGLVLG
jgi:3-deoxy-D-manno-octulosonic acid kinase